MKGQKTGGRNIGTPNKTTAEIRNLITGLLSTIDLNNDINSLTPDKRLEIFIKLLPYVCSKYEDKKDDTGNSIFNFL